NWFIFRTKSATGRHLERYAASVVRSWRGTAGFRNTAIIRQTVDSDAKCNALGVLGLTKERSDFSSLAAAFRCNSKMRRRLRGKENRVGSERWGVALRVRTQGSLLACSS